MQYSVRQRDDAASSSVLLTSVPELLHQIHDPDVELVVWRRHADVQVDEVKIGLSRLPTELWPRCRLDLRPEEARERLESALNASAMPAAAMRRQFICDVADLVQHFAQISQCSAVRLRLDVVTDNACQR